ncbi:hypothetical protein RvY_14772 [Ramazzottius varieornatus]|uniref:Uncharacterized protein n=1 Tax=Ramazzottius varieornatus TaxID=947166 RepID=A0A1D1VW71_RAMVA|nr:hypothetical protein RvY_14772 [Ramazzottius varieornatus]
MDCIRRIHFQAALHDFHVRIFHVPGAQNTIADAISRNDLPRFHTLAPTAATAPETVSFQLDLLRPSLEDSSPSLVDTCTEEMKDFYDQTDVSLWAVDADLV